MRHRLQQTPRIHLRQVVHGAKGDPVADAVDLIDVTARERDGLVPETAHHELEQSADVVVRFAAEYPCHTQRIGHRRRD